MRSTYMIFNLFFLLLCSQSIAQSRQDGIYGKIVVRKGSAEGIIIVNTTKGLEVISDKSGSFVIRCEVGDTLKFSNPNYMEYSYVVNKYDINRNSVLFPLEPLFSMNQLNEIVITKIDSDALGITNQFTKRYTPVERQLEKATTSPGGGMLVVPIDPIVNYLNGKTGMLKKALSYEKEEFRAMRFLETINRERLVSYYNVPADYVDGFVYYAITKPSIREIINAKMIDTPYFEKILTPVVFEFIELISKEAKPN